MTTQYTPTLKLALPVTGELSGTWGDVVNDNITSMIEQAIAGLATINSWTGNAHTLTTANGTTSESRCAMLVAATGGGAPSAAAEIICPAAAKLYVLQNNTSYAVTLKTSAGTGVAVAAGDTAFLFCDGTNVNSCVTTIVNGHITGNLTVDGNATINGNTTLGNATSDTVTVTARVASNVLPSADNTYDLGASANAWKDLYIDGTATMALVAISGGTINGVSIGATTPATFLAVDNLSLDGNTIASTDTNGNIVIAPNGTGDVQLDADTVRVGDSGAAATLTSNGAGALTVTTGGAADLTLSTNSGTDSGTVVIANGVNGNITLTPNGTGDVILSADRVQIGDSNTDTTLTTNGTGSLNLTTNNGTNSGTIQIAQGANGNITLTPNGTGSVSVPKLVWSNGTATRVPYLTTGGQFTDSANLTFNGTDLTVSGAVNAGTINATTLDLTNLEVTNIKAKDGTAAITIADSTGAVSFANNVTLGDASTDTVTVNGRMGIGGSGSASAALRIDNNALSGTNQDGILAYHTGTSGATANIRGIVTSVNTEAASYTVTNVAGFWAGNAGKGAGSTITNLHGLYIADQTQGTNNYGVTSAVSSGSNKWNIYASGTAANYFAGNVGIGTSSPAYKLDVSATARFSQGVQVQGSNLTAAASQITVDQLNTTTSRLISWGADTSTAGILTLGGLSSNASAGSATRLTLETTEAVFNDSGADYDFRVESDTNTHMLFVDAGNNRVGMGTSTPDTVVEIVAADPVLTIRDTDTSTNTANAKIRFAESGAGDTLGEYWDVGLAPISALTFERMGTEHLRIENTGSFITKPLADGPAVFNENGVDADFRVESDTNPYMFFVDAGAGKITMGGSTPGTNDTLTVFQFGGSSANNSQITVDANNGSGTGQAALRLLAGSGTTNRAARVDFLNGVVSTTAPRWTLLTEYNQDGTGDFNLVSQGSDRRMVFYSGSTVFNENGGDVDFRVESDAYTHMLFVDAGNNKVGVNTSTPSGTFEVYNNTIYADTTNIRSYLGQDNNNSTGKAIEAIATNTGSPSNVTVYGLYVDAFNNGSASGASAFYSILTNRGTAVFNESGGDYDFRVESDGSTHMLFVDAGNNRVGIGDNTPQRTFSVQGGTDLLLAGNNTSGGTLRLASNMTDSSVQYGVITQRQYALTAEPEGYTLVAGTSTSTVNYFNLGGGIDEQNMATQIRIFVGPNVSTRSSGVSYMAQYMDASQIVFNEGGYDQDFRVESDANTHMIWVDASNNTVSIGTSLNPQTPANLRAYTGAHIGARVISSIQDLYYGGVGRTFTITGGSNGTTAYLSYTAMNQNGMREETYFFFNAGGNWSYSGPISQTSGTAPSVTISGNNTATLTIQIIGQGSNPNYYNGGIMNYEFYENYVSVA